MNSDGIPPDRSEDRTAQPTATRPDGSPVAPRAGERRRSPPAESPSDSPPRATVTARLRQMRQAADPDASDDSAAGGRLGPYRLCRRLHKGVGAHVFAAEDTRDGRPVAVKVLTPTSARNSAAAEAFLAAAAATAGLDHPNCLRVLDTGRATGVSYVVARLMDGGSAQDALDRDGPYPPVAATRLCRLAARGLAAAHAAGLVHGNLKPSNLLLTRGGDVCLADLGPPRPGGATEADRRADLKAFGSLYNALLTGLPATPGASPGGSAFQPPEACRAVLDALLGEQAEFTCASAAELAEALTQAEDILLAAADEVSPDTTVVIRAPGADRPAATPADAVLTAGTVLGKCVLHERIGRGSSGIVFRGVHQTLKIPVAVKVLHIDGDDQDVRRRLRAEARLLARLNHPNVVRVWDFDDAGEFPYVVLEYVQGLTLADLMNQSGRLLTPWAARVIGQVAEGLAAAEKIGIVHRDVKPANILLARDGTAKLADLGLAMMISGRISTLNQPRQREALAGTVAYMAPEQADAAADVDFRADIYALGATFYHALTGRMPFTGRSPVEILRRHATMPPEPPHEIVPDVPPAASAVILRMMAKEPGDRHQSYDALIADLRRLAAPPEKRAAT
jgi:serine/threonine protein kinase